MFTKIFAAAEFGASTTSIVSEAKVKSEEELGSGSEEGEDEVEGEGDGEGEGGEGGEPGEGETKGEGEGEGEEGAAKPRPAGGKKLTNQFNFCERAALTYNNPCRVNLLVF